MKKKNNQSIQIIILVVGLIIISFLLLEPTKNVLFNSCDRDTPFYKDTEFEGLVNLVYARLKGNKNQFDNDYLHITEEYKNCLVINFSESTNLGTFYPNQNNDLKALKLSVNSSYRNKYDLFTALILSHELTHVGQYIETVKFGKKSTCIESEVYAFKNMLSFFSSLTDYQRRTIIDNLLYDYNPDPTVATFRQLLGYSTKAWNECGQMNKSCFNRTYTSLITKYIKSQPFYQQQCLPGN